MRDDLRTIRLMILACLMALPSSILGAPLSLILSFLITFLFSLVTKQFIDLERVAGLPETMLVFGVFVGGYWQWFGFPQQLKKLISRK